MVYGDVYDAEGSKVRHVFGAWNEAMFCGTEGEEATCIWRVGKVVDSMVVVGFPCKHTG